MSFWEWLRGAPAVPQKKKLTPQYEAWRNKMIELKERKKKAEAEIAEARAEAEAARIKREQELDEAKHEAKMSSYAFEKAKAMANTEDLELDDEEEDGEEKNSDDDEGSSMSGLVQNVLAKFIDGASGAAQQNRGATRMDPTGATKEVKAIEKKKKREHK